MLYPYGGSQSERTERQTLRRKFTRSKKKLAALSKIPYISETLYFICKQPVKVALGVKHNI